jgi:hypothetical protein
MTHYLVQRSLVSNTNLLPALELRKTLVIFCEGFLSGNAGASPALKANNYAETPPTPHSDSLLSPEAPATASCAP